MLSDQAIDELTGSKEELTKFTTAALAHAIAEASVRARSKETAPNHVAMLLESLRKLRADLTGDSHERAMPMMMVNIQLADAATRAPATEIIEHAPQPGQKIAAPLPELDAGDLKNLAVTTQAFGANLDEEPTAGEAD